MLPTEDPFFSDEGSSEQSNLIPSDARVFTIDQANKALALIRVIVRDIVFRARSVSERRERLELLQGPEEQVHASPYSDELKDIEACLAADAIQLRELVGEISQLGVMLHSIPVGQILFLAYRDERPVFLAWGYGEESVSTWIEVGEEFEARRAWTNPVDSELVERDPVVSQKASLTLKD